MTLLVKRFYLIMKSRAISLRSELQNDFPKEIRIILPATEGKKWSIFPK